MGTDGGIGGRPRGHCNCTRMVWFYATAASMRAILSAKAVWAAVNDADVAEKERTASIMARKSRVDMEICCGGAANVLGPSDVVGDGGAGDSIVVTRTADDTI